MRHPNAAYPPNVRTKYPSSGRFRRVKPASSQYHGIHLETKKQLLGGFAGDTGLSAKADLGLFRAPAEINSENHPELQAHVKIRPVFLQNGPELQGTRQKPGDRHPNRPELQSHSEYRAIAAHTTQNSRAATTPLRDWLLAPGRTIGKPSRNHAMGTRTAHNEAESPQTNAQA